MKTSVLWLALASLTAWTTAAQAKPRPPLPPFPELAPLLFRADFDEPFWTRTVKPDALHPAYADLVES